MICSGAADAFAATVVTWLLTLYVAVMGRQLIEAAWPTAPGVTSASIRFSLTQIGERSPSGKPLKVLKSRSSMSTLPFTWRHPGSAHLLGELVQAGQRVPRRLDGPGQADVGVALVQLRQALVVDGAVLLLAQAEARVARGDEDEVARQACRR